MINLSIIIPAYNVEKVIVCALNSIFSQIPIIYEIEVIVVNDGSVDGTLCELNKFKFNNPDCNFKIFSKINGGASSARNWGVDKADGEYIWFFDADDIMEPNCLDSMLNKIYCENLDFLSFGIRDIYPSNFVESNLLNKPSNKVVDGLLYITDYDIEHSPCVFLVKKEIIIKNKIYFLNGVLCEDYDFPLRLYAYCSRISHLKQICYNYMIREGSVSRRNDEEYYILHHESMISIVKYISSYFGTIDNEDYAKEVTKYIVKIKLIAIANLIKSPLPLKLKIDYFNQFKNIKIFDLNYIGKISWTKKQKILLFIVRINIFYPILLLSSF